MWTRTWTNLRIFQGVAYNAHKPIWRRRKAKSDVSNGSTGLSNVKAGCPQKCCECDNIFKSSQSFVFAYDKKINWTCWRIVQTVHMCISNVFMLSITLVVTSNFSYSYTDKVYDWTQQKDKKTHKHARTHLCILSYSLCMPPALIHITHATKLLHATQRIPS